MVIKVSFDAEIDTFLEKEDVVCKWCGLAIDDGYTRVVLSINKVENKYQVLDMEFEHKYCRGG